MTPPASSRRDPEAASDAAVPAVTKGRPAPLPSEQLLRGGRVIEITHNGEVYRLQTTRLGKLILTK